MKVENQVPVQEIDGKEKSVVSGEYLHVTSHWNLESYVVLQFGEQRLTVKADDLNKAIVNATNWKTY